MKKKEPYIINIPKPCHEGWNNMTPTERGRFCNSCQKTVTDFTLMNDKQILETIKKEGSGCGHFYAHQLNRALIADSPRRTNPGYYAKRIAALFIFLQSSIWQVNAQKVQKQQTEQSANQANTITGSALPGEVRGRILDEHRNPMINAKVQLFINDSLRTTSVTDYDGNYRIENIAPGHCKVSIQYTGYKHHIRDNIIIASDRVTDVNVMMTPNSGDENAIEVQQYKMPLIDGGWGSVVTGDDIVKMAKSKETNQKGSFWKRISNPFRKKQKD